MGGISIFQLLILIIIFAPIVHVLTSERSHGGANFGWFLAVIFFSLIGYMFFLIMTQPDKKSN